MIIMQRYVKIAFDFEIDNTMQNLSVIFKFQKTS